MPARRMGLRIRARREALGMKQRDLAAAAGISASYLNLIEHDRRAIAGKVLINIAAALEVDATALADASDEALFNRLRDAAAGRPDCGADLARLPDFVGRFPGWARLLVEQARLASALKQRIEDLSDRLAHDPFLAESLHEILSSVTAIHATAGILVSAGQDRTAAMEVLQRRRFQSNIHTESARLSDLVRALASHFNPETSAEDSPATPRDEVEAFLAAHRYHFDALEQGPRPGAAKDAPRDVAKTVAGLLSADTSLSGEARGIAADVLAQMAEDARALPLALFRAQAEALEFDPLALARRFACSPARIMRRLAFLPITSTTQPAFGLTSCDATGAVLLRKPLSGFALPRYGAACALWPLYQAMGRPHLPLQRHLMTLDDRLFQSTAICEYDAVASPDAPVMRATMLLREIGAPAGAAEGRALRVGQSCRICTIGDCPARREPSIHTGGD